MIQSIFSAKATFNEPEAAADQRLAVSCRGVVKEFGEGNAKVMALRGVDLEVRLGELMMLVGPSGCGKTTLLTIVAGMLDATAGEVVVLGEDLARMSNRQKSNFRGRGIGFVFQQYNLLPALSAAENAAVPLIIASIPRREAVARAEAMLVRLDMADRMHAMTHELSGGQQQRVAIARALVHEPRLLVCDEPTAALDAENGRRTMDLLHEMALEDNRSVIVVTHDSRVFSFGDRIAYMDDGRVINVETREEHARQGGQTH